MDLATLIGIIGAFAFIIGAMVTSGGIGLFIDVPSILIVVAGSLFVVMMKFNLKQFLGSIKIGMKAFMFKLDKPEDLIERKPTDQMATSNSVINAPKTTYYQNQHTLSGGLNLNNNDSWYNKSLMSS